MANPHDVLSINAASASLMISGIPFDGPIGAVRIAHSQNGEWIPHPTYEEGEASTFELVVAGRQLDNGDVAIMMVEAGGTAKSFEYYDAGAPKVDEKVLAGGLEACKVWIKESIALQRQLVASVIATHGPIVPDDVHPAARLHARRRSTPSQHRRSTVSPRPSRISAKAERNAATDAAAAEAIAKLCGEGAAVRRPREGGQGSRSQPDQEARPQADRRRGPAHRRPWSARPAPLSSEVGVLPTAHGTGLFQRGETQVMNVVTMAMPRMNQLMDTLSPETHKYFLFHYNMAPWANGETGRVGSPKRREIGHGALAARALLPVLPSQEEFAYTLRLVAEVLASNGSTSMASVCSGSLALMDAGVPIKAAVAGIAMGLVYAEGKYTTLTDILGAEDAFGDMDFKVAGTADVDHRPAARHQDRRHPRRRAGRRARSGQGSPHRDPRQHERLHPEPRAEVAATAPKIISITIPMDKIGEVIGPKGKVINTIQQETGADIAAIR